MCTWEWDETNHEFIVKGKNGNSIRVPAVGNEDGEYIGRELYYLTSSRSSCSSYNDIGKARVYFGYRDGRRYIDLWCDYKGGCVRLVK